MALGKHQALVDAENHYHAIHSLLGEKQQTATEAAKALKQASKGWIVPTGTRANGTRLRRQRSMPRTTPRLRKPRPKTNSQAAIYSCNRALGIDSYNVLAMLTRARVQLANGALGGKPADALAAARHDFRQASRWDPVLAVAYARHFGLPSFEEQCESGCFLSPAAFAASAGSRSQPEVLPTPSGQQCRQGYTIPAGVKKLDRVQEIDVYYCQSDFKLGSDSDRSRARRRESSMPRPFSICVSRRPIVRRRVSVAHRAAASRAL